MSLPWPGVLEPSLLKHEVVARNHRLAVLETLVFDERWREWLVMPVGPWQGLAVLAAYAGAALLLGGVLFQVRDA